MVEKIRDSLLILVIPLTFISVTPWNNLDGNNPAKFFVLVSLGTIIFSLSIFDLIEKHRASGLDLFQTLGVISVVLIILSVSVNRYSIDERLFGVYGRSLGAITLITLFLVLIAARFFNFKALKLFNYGILLSLVSVAGYFAIQLVDLDPASWEDPYGGIPSSTLGNPNFVSSSLAILSIPLLAAFLFKTHLNLIHRISSLFLLAASFYLILKTQSLQGSFVFAFAFTALLAMRLNEFSSGKLKIWIRLLIVSVISAIPAVTLVVGLGFVSRGGGATLTTRTEYWRSAWNLIEGNLFFGKGFDSFGDWYFFYRDQLAIDRSPGLFTDSPHNLILELGVSGGLPLLVMYLILQSLALRSALRIVSATGNLYAKVIVVMWIGFHLQSAISPSSLALLSLGFMLTGMVYGVGEFRTSETSTTAEYKPPKTKKHKHGLGTKVAANTLALFIAAVGSCVSTVPITKDARFRDAIEQSDGRKMIDVSRQWPFIYQFGRQTAVVLKLNGYEDLALIEVRNLVDTNSYNIQGWKLLYEYSSSREERARAIFKMKELDPLNPELVKLIP